MSGSLPRRRRKDITRANQPRYEKGDPVWVRDSRGSLLPGAVIGQYVEWNLYRVVYMVGIVGQSPGTVEEWRLSPRREGERR
jgi:hypothetical protein